MRWTEHVTYMRHIRNAYRIFVQELYAKDNVEDLDVRITLKWNEDVDWNHPTQDVVQWWAVMNMLMNLWVP